MGKCTSSRVMWGWALQAAGWDTGPRAQPQQPGPEGRRGRPQSARPGGGGSGPLTVQSPCDPWPQRGPESETHSWGAGATPEPWNLPSLNLRSSTRCSVHPGAGRFLSLCPSSPISEVEQTQQPSLGQAGSGGGGSAGARPPGGAL